MNLRGSLGEEIGKEMGKALEKSEKMRNKFPNANLVRTATQEQKKKLVEILNLNDDELSFLINEYAGTGMLQLLGKKYDLTKIIKKIHLSDFTYAPNELRYLLKLGVKPDEDDISDAIFAKNVETMKLYLSTGAKIKLDDDYIKLLIKNNKDDADEFLDLILSSNPTYSEDVNTSLLIEIKNKYKLRYLRAKEIIQNIISRGN